MDRAISTRPSAPDHGIKVGLHNEFFCAINLPNHRELIELTDAKLVHYCIDTAQISIMGEDLLRFYDHYHERSSTFHLEDTASASLPDRVRYAQDPEITDDGSPDVLASMAMTRHCLDSALRPIYDWARAICRPRIVGRARAAGCAGAPWRVR